MEQLLNGLTQLAVTALSFIGVYLIKILVQYIAKKRDLIATQIGIENYNNILQVGKTIFYAIEENFKGLNQVSEQKAQAFDKIILAKFPNLTEEELSSLRQGIVGEFNSQVKANGLIQPINKTVDPIVSKVNITVDPAVTDINAVASVVKTTQETVVETKSSSDIMLG